ncbi:hypothetical protein QJS10_CPB21g00584 [Acorus calamus]|uniref:N-acetyltransferase domain-containing protein n=1 Tax=Acorus calamus TaxID=4465 RepID=A0AAV9C8P9_ACOCL|nr:hypothetical protein QJS10_CPB21g00584 [Acorus calamus]
MAEADKSPPEITLRKFDLTPSDVDDLMSWAGDDRVTRFGRRDAYTNRDDAYAYIRDSILPHPWYRAICVGPSRRAVGSVSVKPGPGADRCRASIGYRLAYDYWGRGIATRAVKMVVKMVFEEWKHLERLEGIVDVENLGSQRVLEKAGFVKEGVLRKYVLLKGRTRDVIMYSVLSSDLC